MFSRYYNFGAAIRGEKTGAQVLNKPKRLMMAMYKVIIAIFLFNARLLSVYYRLLLLCSTFDYFL